MKSGDFSKKLTPEQQKNIHEYYDNDAVKLHRAVDKILKSFGWVTDKSHFYSLANEVFVTEILPKYDGKRSFDAFVTVCLSNKIRSEITHMNRDRRMPYLRDQNGEKVKDDEGKYIRIPIISLDAPATDDNGDSSSYLDNIQSDESVESEIMKEEQEDDRLKRYLDRLSKKQRTILNLLAEGYTAKEIQKRLHISIGEYRDCMLGIHSHENIKILYRG